MAEPRVRTEFWVKAQLRLCDQAMLPAFVRRRGDSDAGVVIVKLDRMNGTSEVFVQARAGDGSRGWVRGSGEGPVLDAEAESYIRRQLSFDPDIWVLELEDPGELYVLDGPLIT
ncbi:MAG: hypothetical protein CMF67_11440 [Magnetovibrio sp.]|nr:hypothetical protein [Magnetovibrio sp.]|tara:strand:+ start:154 stop:495 length:342 start_codon:yes stop_codon:yes gene_type:complete